jgi:tetratricopeptide (TPR) repeat protein
LVKLYAVLADLLNWGCGWYSEGQATTVRAVELARMLGDTQLLAEALAAHAVAQLAVGRLIQAQRTLEEAIPLAEAAGDLIESLPKALWLLSIVHLRYGELDRSTVYCERELVVTEQFGQEARTTAARVLRGLLYYVRGEWAQARATGEHVLAADHHMNRFWASYIGLTVLGLVCYGEGRWDDASRYLEESVARSTHLGHLPALHFAPGVLAEIDLREGRPERARARLAPLIDMAGPEERDVSLLLPPYAWAHLELGDGATAAAIARQASADARARNDRLALADALRVQAMVAIRQQRRTDAEQALEEGLTLARSMPYPYVEARLLHLYGVLHLQQNEPGQAAHRLDAALAIFRRLGAHRDAAQVEDALAALQAKSG